MQILAQIMQIYADYAYNTLFYPMPILCRSIAKTHAKTEMKSVDSEWIYEGMNAPTLYFKAPKKH